MGLFIKPKAVLWPKNKTTEIFIDKKEDNTLSFDINLWQTCSESDLHSISVYLKDKGIDSLDIILPDDLVVTRSFIYDSQIQQIDPKEVVSLAENFVNFKITSSDVDFNLIHLQDKTIIQTRINNQPKLQILYSNLARVNIKATSYQTVSSAIARAVSTFYDHEYFLTYPFNGNSHLLVLAKGDSVYLTTIIKGTSLEIQKIINYSNLYFSSPINKLFYPQNQTAEIISNTNLDKTEFQESQIAAKMAKATNFPLPVLGIFQSSTKTIKTDIINTESDYKLNQNTKNMESSETKKNVLPLIAVFVFTAALASIAIWYVMNRNTQPDTNTQANLTPTEVILIPTEIPLPTLPEVDKKIKIQVLNATEINGQAATLKQKLSNLGFTNITVGNSKEKVQANEIRLKESLSTASSYFVQSMPDFPANIVNTLKESSTYDAVFVIGTDLNNPGAPILTTSPEITGTEEEASPTPKSSPKKSTPTPASPTATTTETPTN